ncbi:MAG: hypothetical protein HLUCCA12_15905 [Rhodobacteraceae bacterium HLUCCA12]|nr:MAG: hypothetical protein HLUCCA12_15905 [Rhodobacteraceae bacterium HLUCCA12]
MSQEHLERLRNEATRPPFNDWLKLESISASAEGVELRLPVRPEMAGGTNPSFVHGGIIASLIDVAGYSAAACATGNAVPTIALQIEYLRPALAETLDARAVVRQKSRKLVRIDIEVSAGGKIVALGRGTFAVQEKNK